MGAIIDLPAAPELELAELGAALRGALAEIRRLELLTAALRNECRKRDQEAGHLGAALLELLAASSAGRGPAEGAA